MMISNFNPDAGLAQSKDFSGAAETAQQPDAEFASILAGICGALNPTGQFEQFGQKAPEKDDSSVQPLEDINFETAVPVANLIQTPLPTDSVEPFSTETENKQALNNLSFLDSQFERALPKIKDLIANCFEKPQNEDFGAASNQLETTALPIDQNEANLTALNSSSIENLVIVTPTISESAALVHNGALVKNNQLADQNNDLVETNALEILESTVAKTIDSSIFQTYQSNFAETIDAPGFAVSRFKSINLSLKNALAIDENAENLEFLASETGETAESFNFFDLTSFEQKNSAVKIQQVIASNLPVDAIAGQPNFNLDKQSLETSQTTVDNSATKVFAELLSNQQTINEKTVVKSSEIPLLHVQIENPLIELAAQIERSRESQTVKLRLRPEELGTVEIKLERAASGELKAQLHTETETARQIIAENLSQLRNSLEQSGFKVDRLDVSCDAFSNSTSSKNSEQSAREQKFENYIDNSIDVELANETNVSAADSDRLLSVRA